MTPSLRLAAAVNAGKLASLAVRGMRRGGGTALPGLVAERVDPQIASRLAGQLGRGCVLITGTNGKTTTSRMLASMLRAAGWPFLHNREGSNLMRGIASSLLSASNAGGAIAGAKGMAGLFETDEATLPRAARELHPRAITFTNLFRDQLDRYGEVDSVFALWQLALRECGTNTTIVLNADDPSVADLADEWHGQVAWFGLDDEAFATDSSGAFDARWCRRCGGSYSYTRLYFAHVGLWKCEGCGRERERSPGTVARDVRLKLASSTFAVDGLGEVSMPLTGLYNVYNALAAIATARSAGVEEQAIVRGLATVRPAFGRQEVATLEGRRLHLMLVKNPAGANQALQLLGGLVRSSEIEHLKVAVMLNDRFADGQDVSWTWDVDFEPRSGQVERCWVGGTRAADMALRLKYAHWPVPGIVTESPARLLDAIVQGTAPGDEVFVIPTYTALLDLRAEMARRGSVGAFFGEGS